MQELAFTLRDGIEYVDWALERGLAVDEFAPRLSFFFNAHNDFFEEIAKYRAARKIWAQVMRERYGASSERSMKLRFHAQTAGCSLTWQQPYNNVVRTALAGHGRGPGRRAIAAHQFARRSLRPAQRAGRHPRPAHPAGAGVRNRRRLTNPIRWAAAIFLEKLTLDTEGAANDYIRRIDEMGGMVPAIEAGFPQSEIAAASYALPARN